MLKISKKRLQTFDSNLFIGLSYLNNGGTQLYLIFQPLYYTLKGLGDTDKLHHGNPKVCQL